MWDFFIDNRRFSFLLIFVLLGFGLFSINSIPKESSPEVQIPIGIITTVLPGASAIDIENLVTNELERGLVGSLENVKKVNSTSRESVSSITVEFNAGADIDESISELKDKVETLINRLPNDAERPVVSEVNFVDQPIITIAFAGDRTDAEFSALSDKLEEELETVAGISRVEKSGVRTKEVSVLVDQASLLRYSLTINDVVNGIRSANSVLPVGQIVTDNVSYNIVFEGDIANIESVFAIPIAVKGGQPILVRDVAEVVQGLSPTVTTSRLSIDSEPSQNSFTLSLYKKRGGDITIISDDVAAKLAELKQTPDFNNISFYTIQDAGELIKKDLVQLSTSGLQTVVLVIIVLILTIGWREGLIAGLAIPLSFMIGFIGLYLSGNTINFLSLFALILGIGVLVDSGIVIVEGIDKRMKEDKEHTKIEAAKLTVKEFGAPLVSGTLTTVSMFVGLFVVSGVTGQFIASIPFTLIFVLFAALLVALGFLPLISTALLKRKSTNKMEVIQTKYSHIVENWYQGVLRAVLSTRSYKKRFLAFLIVGFISAIALIPAGLVKVVFFEQSDVDQLFLEIKLPEGSVRESTDIIVRQVEEVLYQKSEFIEAFSVTVGSGSAFGGGGVETKLANFYIALKEDRTLGSTAISNILSEELDGLYGAEITVAQPSDGPPTGSAIGVKLFGDDFADINQSALEVTRILESIEGTKNISAGTDTNSTEFVFTLDKPRAIAAGLTPQAISQTLRSAVFGTTAAEINSADEAIDVVVRLNLLAEGNIDPEFANRTSIDTLQSIKITTPSGNVLPLSALVGTTLRESSAAINHEDQKRVITVSADITPTGNVIDINNELTEKLSQIELPGGVAYSLGGESEESNQAFGELFLALIVGVVLMIGVLVLQFDSYRHTFYVISILPFSLIGILFGLAITGSSLSFPSILGFIALSGIIVNNSILLIDMMNQTRRKFPDMNIQDVVVSSSVKRLRPIILTSLTTIVGMVPLLYTDEIWIPLATAIIFGLMFSVIITLLLIPIIYSKWPGIVRKTS